MDHDYARPSIHTNGLHPCILVVRFFARLIMAEELFHRNARTVKDQATQDVVIQIEIAVQYRYISRFHPEGDKDIDPALEVLDRIREFLLCVFLDPNHLAIALFNEGLYMLDCALADPTEFGINQHQCLVDTFRVFRHACSY